MSELSERFRACKCSQVCSAHELSTAPQARHVCAVHLCASSNLQLGIGAPRDPPFGSCGSQQLSLGSSECLPPSRAAQTSCPESRVELLGRCFKRSCRAQGAAEDIAAAMALDPANAHTLIIRAEVLASTGNFAV